MIKNGFLEIKQDIEDARKEANDRLDEKLIPVRRDATMALETIENWREIGASLGPNGVGIRVTEGPVEEG